MKAKLAFAVVLAAAVFGMGHAQAAEMLFTATMTTSGSLNGVAFTNALVTISGSADTSGIFSPSAGVFAIDNVPLSLTVQGLGSAHFTDSMDVASNQTFQDVGFGDITQSTGLMFVTGVANSGYDLSTPFGPAMGTPGAQFPGETFATDQGAFTYSGGVQATFQATLDAVPEPSTWLMMIGGLSMLGAMLRRCRGLATA